MDNLELEGGKEKNLVQDWEGVFNHASANHERLTVGQTLHGNGGQEVEWAHFPHLRGCPRRQDDRRFFSPAQNLFS